MADEEDKPPAPPVRLDSNNRYVIEVLFYALFLILTLLSFLKKQHCASCTIGTEAITKRAWIREKESSKS